MGTFADELITRYTLDASGYKRGSREVIQSSKQADKAISQMKASAKSLASSFTDFTSSLSAFRQTVSSLVGHVTRFAAIGAAGLIALGTYAVSAAMEMDTLERRLLGVTGSAEKAGELLEVIKRLAADSMFEMPPVAEAGILLEAFGLSAKRFLPTAVNLAQAMGGSTEKMMEFVSLLGRAKGGDLGEVFGVNGLARFGMSKEFFEGLGAQFGSDGRFVGSVTEALDLIEQAVNLKFSEMSKNMEEGPAAKWASAMDAMKFAAAGAGGVILDALLPVLERVTQIISNLAEGGYFVRIAEAFISLFNLDIAQGPLGKGMAWFEQAIKDLPVNIVKFYNEMGHAFERVGNLMREIAIWVAISFAGQIIGALTKFVKFAYELGKVLKNLVPILRAYATAQGIANVVATGGVAAVTTAAGLAVLLGALYGAYKVADEHIPKVPEFVERPLPTFDEPDEPPAPPTFEPYKPGDSESGNPVVDALNNIKTNTKATAENTQKQLDLQRYALGGGDLARLGITPVEMRGRASTSGPIRVYTGNKHLDEWLSEAFGKMVIEMKRRGAV